MDDIKRMRVNFFDKNLFNVWFYLTNLYWPRVINKRMIVEVNRADRADRGKVDKKNADGSGTTSEDLVIEDLVSEDPDTILENSILENWGTALENTILKDIGIA